MEKGFSYIILRNMEVYGKYMAKHKIYRRLCESCLNKEKDFKIEGDGKNFLDTMYIDDYIEGMIKVINSNLKNEIIDFCKSEPVTLKQLAGTIKNVFENPDFKLACGGIPTENTKFKLGNEKMKQLLDFHPKTSLEKGLKLWKSEGLK